METNHADTARAAIIIDFVHSKAVAGTLSNVLKKINKIKHESCFKCKEGHMRGTRKQDKRQLEKIIRINSRWIRI